MGDFKCLLGQHEKQGGTLWTNRAGNSELESHLLATDTNDLGFVGNPFTWSNNRQPPNRILERLDRCLGNAAWTDGYGSLSVHHLTRITSYHCPILLTEGKLLCHRPHHFRFENMWTIQPGFNDVAHHAWYVASMQNCDLADKLLASESKFTAWKNESFGSFLVYLRRLEDRIRGTQSSRHYQISTFLSNLDSI